MKKFSLVTAAFFTLMCGHLLAQDSTQTPMSPDQGMPPEMRQLAPLVGTWDIVNLEKVPGKDEWKESKATAEFRYILDSCVLELQYHGMYDGKPFTGHALRCWNRYTKGWEMVWTDDYAAMFGMHYGESADWKTPLTWKTEMPGGGSMWGRNSIVNFATDSMDWTYDMSMDSGKTWITQVKAHYTRHK